MAQGQGFRTRIGLDGEQEVTRGFAAIGRAGEQAFGNMRKAVEGSSRGFLTFRGNLNDLSTSFQGVARTSIGFKTAIAGIVTGGAVAGITAFVKASATAADDIGDAAAGLGLSAERFQEFKLAARTAGLDIEKFSAAFAKLSATVDTESKKQVDALTSIGKAFSGDQIINQSTTVLRGMQDIKAASVEAGVAVGRGADQAKSGFIKISDTARDKLGGVADLLRGAFKQVGVTALFPNLESQLAKASQGTSDAAVKIRKSLSDLGVELPAETVGEALDKLAETAEQKLGSFVQLWERTGEGLRKRKLEDVFLDFADAMAAIEDPAVRSSNVIGVFGARIGARLVPLLKDGRKGILDVGEAFTKAGLNFSTADTEIGGKFADQLDILSTALTNAKNVFALPISAAFQPVLEAATKSIQDNAVAIRAWGADVAGRLQPAIADFVALIGGANKAELKTEFAKDLVGVFQSIRDAGPSVLDTVKLIGAAFRGLFAAADAALAPVNAVFGTRFRGDVLLGVLALAKMVGGFAAISAAISLAKVGLIAFTAIARLSPFGLLAAAVAIFVAKMSDGTDVAKKFWDSITGDTGGVATALSDTASNAAKFGTAAAEAEKAVAGALGETQRLGDAVQTTSARFVNMGATVPKMAGALPSVQRGIEQVGDGVEDVRGKIVDVTAQTAAFRKEVEAAAKAGAKTEAATAAPILETPSVFTPDAKNFHKFAGELRSDTDDSVAALGNWTDSMREFARTVEKTSAEIIGSFTGKVVGEVAGRQIADFVRLASAALNGDWKRAWQDAKILAADTIDGVKQDLAALAAATGLDKTFENIGKNAVEQAKLDSFLPPSLEVPQGWTADLANWAKDAAARVGDVFTQMPTAGDPAFLGAWGLAVDKFSTDSTGKIRDQFSQLGVPAEPGFLASWGSALTSWLSGQVTQIKTAFSGLSFPSLISSAQAAPLAASGAGAAGVGEPATGGVAASTTQAIEAAKSQLSDLVTSISTAITDAVTRITELITNTGVQLQDFFTAQVQLLTDLIQQIIDGLSAVVDNATTVIADGIQSAFDTLQSSATTVFDSITSAINGVSGLLASLADSLSGIAAAVGGLVSSAAGLIPGFAGGGHVRGPGGDTGDKIPAWVSNYEYINQARSVRHYGVDFFHALNRLAIPRDIVRKMLAGMQGFSLGGLVGDLSIPIVQRSMPAFAAGGLVSIPAGAGAASVPSGPKAVIVIDGREHGFIADDQETLDSFTRAMRKKRLVKA